MKPVLIALIAFIAVLPFARIDRAAAQARCLHGPQEDAAQKARRFSALRLVRAINTAEANEAWPRTHGFAPPENLSVDLNAAPEFESDFTTDGKTYALILHDKMDACGFVFATNQNGVIFQGYPIDYDVQPISR